MRRNFLQLSTIFISLIMFSNITSSVSGTNGFNVWDEGDYMIFEADIKFIYNHAYYPAELFPNIDLVGEEITIKYDVLNDSSGKMIFSETLLGETPIIYEVDPVLGLTSDNDRTYLFTSTEGWTDGYATEYKVKFEYQDDFGIHSETQSYKVVGELFAYSMMVDNVNKAVSSWNLEINNELEYVLDGSTYKENYLLRYTFTDGNGVLVKQSEKQEISIKALESTTFETLWFFEFEMEAKSSEGVILNSRSSGSDSGFLYSITPLTTLLSFVFLVVFYRRQKS